ncbi:ribokinase (plasmid) [Azospirillum sp. B510]|uniref:ribokinase n=1 Tax=Azospirillum sp. (strain B510) TaxID=137722 RepID=UPI0001C4C65B|nr:ribokinase [Azospirillum sp. B510]BAI75012.1 ribokinase [Azospirillum sp. B510]
MTKTPSFIGRPITVFGSVNIDVCAYSDRLPRPGETVHGGGYAMGLGGKGANQAAAAARLGGQVEMVGRTGDDAFGEMARGRLAGFGVRTSHLSADPDHPTGIAVIGVEASGENCITVVGGANMAVSAEDAARAAPLFASSAILLLQLETPLAAGLAAAAAVRAGGGRVILDPAPAPRGGLAAEVFQAVDAMTPNETETESLVGLRPTSPEEAAAAADRLIGCGLSIAIVKMGGKGLYYRGPGQQGYLPPFPVNPIDTVAAGDCFNGGLAFALARGDDLAAAVRFASACGALATTRAGAADSAPTLAEVTALLG